MPELTIDATCLGRSIAGTQVATLQTITALARHEAMRLRVAVAEACDAATRQLLRSLPLVSLHLVGDPISRPSAIVHRPFQVRHMLDVALFERLGVRTLLTQWDLIAYDTEAYFANRFRWRHYRSATEAALGRANAVVCPSRYVFRQVCNRHLAASTRCVVIPAGVDHILPAGQETPPPRAGRVANREFLLCVGADYRHKNRLFALRLARALKRHHGWDGAVVFIGPHIRYGSSEVDETVWEDRQQAEPVDVVRLGDVTEAEKAWLYRRARLVVYPTTEEGFGLIPFEAAAHGVPCLFASVTSLRETLPSSLAAIKPWDPDATAPAAWRLMRDEALRASHVASVMEAGKALSWSSTATQLLSLYEGLLTSRDGFRPESPRRLAPGARAQLALATGVLGAGASLRAARASLKGR